VGTGCASSVAGEQETDGQLERTSRHAACRPPAYRTPTSGCLSPLSLLFAPNICMLAYTHVHTIYICKHISLYPYLHKYTHAYLHTYIHTCLHTYIYAYIHTYINTSLPLYMCAYTYIYIHSYIYLCINIHIYTCLYICAHT